MFIKFILVIFISVFSLNSGGNENSLSIEVVESKQTLLSRGNISHAEIKQDAGDKPYIELTLNAEGVNQVKTLTRNLIGQNVNIWLGDYPVSLSTKIQSEISSTTIRIPTENIEQANIIFEKFERKK